MTLNVNISVSYLARGAFSLFGRTAAWIESTLLRRNVTATCVVNLCLGTLETASSAQLRSSIQASSTS